MVTYFNRKDLVSFGSYLLSEKRKVMFQQHPYFLDDELLAERLKEVHHSDVENWKKSLDK